MENNIVEYHMNEQSNPSIQIIFPTLTLFLDKKKTNRTMIWCQLKDETSNNKSILIIVIYSTVKGQQEMIKILSRSREGQPININ